MFKYYYILLYSTENDLSGTKWKWTSVRQGGIKITPRCSSSAILIQPNLAYMFGGVLDQEDNEEELNGTFFNDLVALNLEKYQWHTGNHVFISIPLLLYV